VEKVFYNIRRFSFELRRRVPAVALIIIAGLIPQQGHAAPCKPDQPATPATTTQPAPAKPEQPAPAKPGPATSRQPGAGMPTLSLGDNTIRIPVGAPGGLVQLIMKAENLTEGIMEAAPTPSIKDLGGAGSVSSTKVKFENPVEIDKSPASRAWLWTACVEELPPNSSQNRNARLTYGKLDNYIPYTLTNLSPANFTWSVSAPGNPWIVWFGPVDSQNTTSIVVTTGDYPASNLRLAQSSLQNSLGTSQIGLKDLELCGDPSCPGGQLNVKAHTAQTFYVRLKRGGVNNGKYTGTLSFAINERPELQTVNFTLQVSSLLAKLLGALLVSLGVGLAWWVSVWARARLLRLEAQKPVAALQESINVLVGDLDQIKAKIGKEIPNDDSKTSIRTKLNEISKGLTTEALDEADYLPPRIPRPFSGGPDTANKLKEYLTKRGDCVDGLTVLIRDGMNKVLLDWGHPSKPQEAIIDALRTLNEKGDSITDRPTAEQAVKDALQQYLSKLDPKIEFDASAPGLINPPTTQYLSWVIGQIYAKVWWIWGILTFLGGLAVLILRDPGFGTGLDLLFCSFWGFGLPTTMDKLQQLSPSGIATTIGMIQPKPAS
jgi:hypothetical protein